MDDTHMDAALTHTGADTAPLLPSVATADPAAASASAAAEQQPGQHMHGDDVQLCASRK